MSAEQIVGALLSEVGRSKKATIQVWFDDEADYLRLRALGKSLGVSTGELITTSGNPAGKHYVFLSGISREKLADVRRGVRRALPHSTIEVRTPLGMDPF